jgi:hypothetical protein
VKVEIIDHAWRSMRQRRITEQDVRETLETPDDVQMGDYGRYIAFKSFGNRRIRVVYEEPEPDAYVVVTVF